MVRTTAKRSNGRTPATLRSVSGEVNGTLLPKYPYQAGTRGSPRSSVGRAGATLTGLPPETGNCLRSLAPFSILPLHPESSAAPSFRWFFLL